MLEDDFSGFARYDYFDWYDYDKVKKLNENHSRQWLKLYKKIKNALEKGDQKAVAKIQKTLQKHDEKGQRFKQKAEEAGYSWC